MCHGDWHKHSGISKGTWILLGQKGTGVWHGKMDHEYVIKNGPSCIIASGTRSAANMRLGCKILKC